MLRGTCGVWTRRLPYLHWLPRCPRCHPVAVAENTITEPTETPTTVPGHHAGEDKPASGTGEVRDLPAPPEHERGCDAATDAARPAAVVADIRAKLAAIRRQKAS